MSHWEANGKSDEWYTPKYIFDAMDCTFDMDVAAPQNGPLHVPCKTWISQDSLTSDWSGFVWMNPPFGGRNGLVPWLDKFAAHGNGVALVPDRTSAPWWQDMADWAELVMFVGKKVKFIKPDGTLGASPSVGTTLLAVGGQGIDALLRAEWNGLGVCFKRKYA
jgi:hypothetical protein